MRIPSVESLLILAASLLAGWIVNLVVDAVPRRRAPLAVWYWPICQWPRPLAARVLRALGHDASCAACPHAPRRHVAVWIAAVILGWLAFRPAGWRSDSWLAASVVALYAWFFLAVAAIDLEHRLVLNRMVLPALPMAMVGNLLVGLPSVPSALSGAAFGFGLFLVLALAWPGAMGMGDVKLAGVIGLTVGVPGVFVAVVVCILAGGLAGFIALIGNRFRPGRTIAYAPYLALGAWTALYFGGELWTLYLHTL